MRWPAEARLVGLGQAGRPRTSLIGRYCAKRSIRSGALWGYIFGITVASSALTYTWIYKTAAERRRLAGAFGANHAVSALFGPAADLQTVAGFTVFKVSMTVMVAGALWGVLMSTRLLRGEEDAGRWEILLAGQSTRTSAVGQALAGLGVGTMVLWSIVGVFIVAVGRLAAIGIGVGAGVYFAVTLVASPLMFLGIGAVTSQLAASRRRAVEYGAVVLGLSYGVRMVADAGLGLHWLIWASPLGWVEELQPLTHPQALALLPILALAVASSISAPATLPVDRPVHRTSDSCPARWASPPASSDRR
jgi:ABC-2 type transport system permease protein